MAERAKADRAQKRKAPSDEDDELEEDEEEQTSDSDSDRPLVQAIEVRERRAAKLRKLEKERKMEEDLDKSLAEQEAKNAKQLKALTAARNSFPSGDDEVDILLIIELPCLSM